MKLNTENMKAITAVCATGASVPAVVSGRVSRHRDGENAEIKMYLSKLKDLVPFMPKNRKLSKLEIIQHVIDYICDLQSELETHPAVNSFDAAAALNGQATSDELQAVQQQLNNSLASIQQQQRQPLCVRSSPNTILSTTTTHCSPLSSVPSIHNSSHSHTTSEKSSSSDSSHC